MSFLARFAGVCPVCEKEIVADESILAWQVGGVVHYHCMGKEHAPEIKNELCDKCFVEKPVTGAHECGE